MVLFWHVLYQTTYTRAVSALRTVFWDLLVSNWQVINLIQGEQMKLASSDLLVYHSRCTLHRNNRPKFLEVQRRPVCRYSTISHALASYHFVVAEELPTSASILLP